MARRAIQGRLLRQNPGTASKIPTPTTDRVKASCVPPRPHAQIMTFGPQSSYILYDRRSQNSASAQTKIPDLLMRGDRGRPAPNLGPNRASYFSSPAASSRHCCAVSSKTLLLAGSLVFAANSAHSPAFVRYSSDFSGMQRCPTLSIAPSSLWGTAATLSTAVAP
jgi:hypothetical protein